MIQNGYALFNTDSNLIEFSRAELPVSLLLPNGDSVHPGNLGTYGVYVFAERWDDYPTETRSKKLANDLKASYADGQIVVTDTLVNRISEETDAYDLAFKKTLMDYAAHVRYTKEVGGMPSPVNGVDVTFPTSRGNDRLSLTDTLIAINAGLRSNSAVFKFPDGASRVVTNAEMAAAIAACFAHVQHVFDIEAEVITDINNATITTIEEIDKRFN